MDLLFKKIEEAKKLKELYEIVSKESGTLARSPAESDIEYFESVLEKTSKSGISIGVYDAESLIGFVYAYKFEPKVFAHTLANMTIAIHPGYQGQRLGSKLLKKFIEQVQDSKEIKRIELFTPAVNIAAIKLYESHGFIQEGIFRDRAIFKGKLVDDIAMAWLKD